VDHYDQMTSTLKLSHGFGSFGRVGLQVVSQSEDNIKVVSYGYLSSGSSAQRSVKVLEVKRDS
ncbi:hypothetical protein BgiMline_018315, partial [Biomphalaria glabrata]